MSCWENQEKSWSHRWYVANSGPCCNLGFSALAIHGVWTEGWIILALPLGKHLSSAFDSSHRRLLGGKRFLRMQSCNRFSQRMSARLPRNQARALCLPHQEADDADDAGDEVGSEARMELTRQDPYS